jgi:hypothetical protein
MSKLTQSYTIDLSSGASFDVYLEDLVDIIFLSGTAGGNVQIQKAGASTALEGMMLTFKFSGNMNTNTLTLFGEAIKYTSSKQWMATCLYRNAAWEVRVMPDFEEDQIIETSHIKDLNVTAGKLTAALNLTAQTITNINVDSGTIDGTTIGGSTPGAVTTSALVATTADINGGTIDGAAIGANVPSSGAFTTVNASGNITGNLVGNVTGVVTGNASTATILAVSRTIAGTAFNGSANIDIAPENLLGVSAVAADIELLAGAAAAGLTASDLVNVKNISINSETKDNAIQGGLRVKIIESAELISMLDTTSVNLVPMDSGDVILSIEFITATVSGAACTVNIGPDASIRTAGLDADGFIKTADANAKAVYQTFDPAQTYTGDRIIGGYFVCDADGFIVIRSSTDQKASTFVGTVIVKYIPA